MNFPKEFSKIWADKNIWLQKARLYNISNIKRKYSSPHS